MCCFVAYNAVVSRNTASAAEMTPGAVPIQPIADMRAWRSLIMASHAVILPMTGKAPLTITAGHKTVAQRSPSIRVIARHLGGMAGNAVVSFMADHAGFIALPCIAQVQIRSCAVIHDPVSPVRIRPGKRYLALYGRRASGLDGSCISAFCRIRDRKTRYQYRCNERKQAKHASAPSAKNHNASPL
jgi:hypothetical protein